MRRQMADDDEIIRLRGNIRRAAEAKVQNGTMTVTYWETADDGKKVYDYVVKKEGKVKPKDQNILDYIVSATKGSLNLGKNFFPMRKINFTDKYKHAFMNCNAAQYGKGGADIAKLASDLREWNDVRTGSNTLDSSKGDNYANKVGRLLGSKYPKGDCNALIEKYIKKNW